MAGNFQEIYTDDVKSLIYDNSHITIYATYYKDGTPVDITSPEFTLKDAQSQDVNVTLMKPVHKDRDVQEEAGKYLVSFLSKGLNAGNYTAEFKGTYKEEELTASTEVELFVQPREQYLIDLLRISLGAKYTTEVPRLYYTLDATQKQWRDGELWSQLNRSLNAINCVPPISYFTIADIPCENLLIMGAQIYTLTMTAALEDANYFDITIPVKVILYKGDKLKDLARFLKDQWQEPLWEWKKYYTLEGTSAHAIAMKRVPIRLLRPVSDNLYFHSLAW